MATYLYRLGGWAFRRRRTVLLAWITVLGLVVASAAAFSGQTNDRFSVPGTESQQAQDLLEQKFPGAGGASARMVFAAPAGREGHRPGEQGRRRRVARAGPDGRRRHEGRRPL